MDETQQALLDIKAALEEIKAEQAAQREAIELLAARSSTYPSGR